MTLILYLFGVFVKKTSKFLLNFQLYHVEKWINIRKISPSKTVLNASFHKAILLPHRISEKKPYKLGKEILCEFENSDFSWNFEFQSHLFLLKGDWQKWDSMFSRSIFLLLHSCTVSSSHICWDWVSVLHVHEGRCVHRFQLNFRAISSVSND